MENGFDHTFHPRDIARMFAARRTTNARHNAIAIELFGILGQPAVPALVRDATDPRFF